MFAGPVAVFFGFFLMNLKHVYGFKVLLLSIKSALVLSCEDGFIEGSEGRNSFYITERLLLLPCCLINDCFCVNK